MTTVTVGWPAALTASGAKVSSRWPRFIFGGSAMSQLLRLHKAPEELTVEEMRAITRFACCAASLSTQTHGDINSVVPEAEVRAIL